MCRLLIGALLLLVEVVTVLEGCPPDLLEGCSPYPTGNETCDVGIEELDFLHETFYNLSNVDRCKDLIRYPCEVRLFWTTGWFKTFVATVRFVYKWGLPPVIVVGVVLNVFAFSAIKGIKQENSKRNKVDPGCHLKAIYIFGQYQCISDIGALLLPCFFEYCRSKLPEVDHLFKSNIWICRADKVTTAFFQYSSPWMNVIIALMRWYDLKLPMRSRQMTSLQIHRNIIVVIFVLGACASVKLYFSGFDQYPAFEYQRCEEPGHTNLYMTAIDIGLAYWLPTFILIAINCSFASVMKQREKLGRLDQSNQIQKGIKIMWTVSVFYFIVQIPLGVVESIELYWSIVEGRKICPTDREEMAYWRKVKLILRWTRAIFYFLNQLGFVINLSCLLLTRADFRKFFGKGLIRLKIGLRQPEPVNSEIQSEIMSEIKNQSSLLESMNSPLLPGHNKSSNLFHTSQRFIKNIV